MKDIKKYSRLTLTAVRRVFIWFYDHRIGVYASQGAFYILMSAVPMTIFALAIAAYVAPLSSSGISLSGLFPPPVAEVVGMIASEAKMKANMPLLSSSAILLTWSASRGIRGIGGGIRNVYGGDGEKSVIVYALKSLIMTFLYICSLIIALTVCVFGDTILRFTEKRSVTLAVRLINGGALFMLLSFVFILTYRAYSGKRSNETVKAPGAFFSAAGWLTVSSLFEYYVEHFSSYSYVYGGIASLIAVMIWLYFCIEMLLIGAGINVLIGKKRGNKIFSVDTDG